MKLTIMIIIYTLGTAAALALLYGLLRRALDPEHEHPARIILPILIALALFAFPLTGALTPDGPLCWFFQRWGNIYLGYSLYFFGPLLLVWLILLPVRIIHRLRYKEKWAPSRSVSVVFLIVLIGLTVSLNVMGWKASHDVKVTNYSIDKAVLGQTESKRIILIGDLHMGVNSSTKLYEDMVDRVNEQNADLIVIAGDIVTSSYGAMEDPDAYAAVLSKMKAKDGVYVVYGNHDVEEPLLGGFTFIGAENAKRHPEMPGFLKSCGWTLLADESLQPEGYNGLWLVGRRDESRPGDGVTERASLKELTAGIDPEEPILLLQHEPSDLEELDDYGIDLSVSGHTHDGQLFPGNVFSRVKGPQSYGLRQWGDSMALVTSGVGYYGPPVRVGTISEIAVIDVE